MWLDGAFLPSFYTANGDVEEDARSFLRYVNIDVLAEQGCRSSTELCIRRKRTGIGHVGLIVCQESQCSMPVESKSKNSRSILRG